MSRTSMALKRLGVAGTALVTIGAGVPAFFATPASAVQGNVATVTLTPDTDTAAVGTCNPFTITLTQGGNETDTETIDVQLSQTAPAGSTPTALTIGFCNPGTAASTNPQATASDGKTTGGTPTPPANPGPSQTCASQPTTATTSASVTCNGEFTFTGNTATFGVTSSHAGTMNVQAYAETVDNDTPNIGEPDDTSTKTWVAGGAAGATALDCEPETDTNPEGTRHDWTCTAYQNQAQNITVANVPVYFDVTAGPNASIGFTQCGSYAGANNTGAFTAGNTNNNGQVTCSYTDSTATSSPAGTDTIYVYIEQGAANSGPQNGEPFDQISKTWVGGTRNISCAPKTSNPPSGGVLTITCTVKDVNGNAVGAGQVVEFTETGAGRFISNTFTTTNSSGTVSVEVTTQPAETGTQTVTATLRFDCGVGGQCQTAAERTGTTEECEQLAGAGPGSTTTTPAGNCTDSVTVNWGGSASPSSSPTAGGRGTLSTSTPDIQPNITGVLNATGLTAGAVYELRCYSRPSTTYFTARTATVSQTGNSLEVRILPGTNTRCYVRPAGNESLASNSVVINVHTTLSLSAIRTGVRTYLFQGRNLPRRSGQLITLYRIANGQEIRTANLVTDASGIYRLTRTFTGTGTFQFRVRSGVNLTNAAGASNIITVRIF